MSSLIRIRAKVMIMTEEDFEWDETLGPRNKKDNPEWDWRTKVIYAENICELTRMTKDLTIIEDISGNIILVKEPINDLKKKWEDALPKSTEITPVIPSPSPSQEEENEEDED